MEMQRVLTIIMFTGIVFYAALLVFYFLGKNKMSSSGKVQDFGIGKVNIKASEFMVLAIISAIFIVSPIMYDYFREKDQLTIEAGKPKDNPTDYVIRGRAVDEMEKVRPGVMITAEKLQNDTVREKRSNVTDVEGHYEFRFKKVKPDDAFRITWSEPDNKPKTREFNTNEITYVVKITANSN